MTQRKKPTKKSPRKPEAMGGPYLAAAMFCEKIVEDKDDGALTVIRMIDKITVLFSPPPNLPRDAQLLTPVNIAALLAFKTGDSPGQHRVRLQINIPSGTTQTTEYTLNLSKEPYGGQNLRLNNTIALDA